MPRRKRKHDDTVCLVLDHADVGLVEMALLMCRETAIDEWFGNHDDDDGYIARIDEVLFNLSVAATERKVTI